MSKVSNSRDSFDLLTEEIIQCRKCSRLVEFRERIAREKTKRFAEWQYWGKPVPGFGDREAELVIVGLAPAPHGGNRTGRVFTGDLSARFLMRNLYEAGFANKPDSVSADDGLELFNAYMLAAVRCVPPENKPTSQEAANCYPYFRRELLLLSKKRVILALGRFAFDASLKFIEEMGADASGKVFRHGAVYRFKGLPSLYASYHPSPRNTNTGTLTGRMFLSLLKKIRNEIAR
jgi:uracil-DNA glycosylase family 4